MIETRQLAMERISDLRDELSGPGAPQFAVKHWPDGSVRLRLKWIKERTFQVFWNRITATTTFKELWLMHTGRFPHYHEELQSPAEWLAEVRRLFAFHSRQANAANTANPDK